MSNSLNTNAIVTVTDNEGTATSKWPNSVINNIVLILLKLPENMDYRIFGTSVTFKAGDTRVQYSGSQVVDDGLVELDETFDLIIDNSSLPAGVSLGDPCQTRITIVDDDSE